MQAATDPAQRPLEIGNKGVIRPVSRARTRDKYIIGSWLSLIQQDRRRCAAQPPLRPVAGNRIPNLSACGEPDPDQRDAPRFRRPMRGLQDQTGRYRPAPGGSDTQEIGAALERYKPAVRRIPGWSGRIGRDRLLKQIDVYDPLPAAPPALCGRLPSPYAPGTHGGACERVCWVGKCA